MPILYSDLCRGLEEGASWGRERGFNTRTDLVRKRGWERIQEEEIHYRLQQIDNVINVISTLTVRIVGVIFMTSD